MSKTINADVTKENYKGYFLTVKVNSGKACTDRFYGEAHKEGEKRSNATKSFSFCNNDKDELLKQLKKSIDNREIQISESQRQQASPIVITEEKQERTDSITQETDLVDTQNEQSKISKDEPKTKPADSDVVSSIEKLLEKHFSKVTKKIEKIEERLEKLESNRELTSKIEVLTQITKQNQNNVDKFNSDFAEKLQVQEQRLVDILSKIDTLAEAEFLNGHLTQLQLQSEKLHERLDNKIDLQDAEHLFDLRNEIEKDIESHLIQTISKKIMPVLDNLKDKINNDPEKISDAMQDLENRCISAGLKRLRGI